MYILWLFYKYWSKIFQNAEQYFPYFDFFRWKPKLQLQDNNYWKETEKNTSRRSKVKVLRIFIILNKNVWVFFFLQTHSSMFFIEKLTPKDQWPVYFETWLLIGLSPNSRERHFLSSMLRTLWNTLQILQCIRTSATFIDYS